MARLPRFSPVGVPVHIIQRGNNRQACFVLDEDYGAYASWLKEYSGKYKVDIHAWVMMTNLCIYCAHLDRDEIELLTGRRVKAKKRGRPLGWRKEKI